MSSDSQQREASLAVARKYLDAISRGDLEANLALLAEDAVLELRFAPPGIPRRTEGKAAIEAFMGPVGDAIEAENFLDIELDTMHGDPSVVVAQFHSDMKLKVPGSYKNQYIGLITVRDGQVARFVEFFDPIPLQEALGGVLAQAPEPGR